VFSLLCAPLALRELRTLDCLWASKPDYVADYDPVCNPPVIQSVIQLGTGFQSGLQVDYDPVCNPVYNPVGDWISIRIAGGLRSGP
jgi:hypothetical protein